MSKIPKTNERYRIRCVDYGDLDAKMYVGKDGMFAENEDEILYFDAASVALACVATWNDMKENDPYFYKVEVVRINDQN